MTDFPFLQSSEKIKDSALFLRLLQEELRQYLLNTENISHFVFLAWKAIRDAWNRITKVHISPANVIENLYYYLCRQYTRFHV